MADSSMADADKRSSEQSSHAGPVPGPADASAQRRPSPASDNDEQPPSTLPPELVAGEFVDRFRVVAPLRQAGVRPGYLAHDERLQRELELAWLGTETGDARALAALTDAGLARVYDVIETPYGYFAAVEHLQGMTLDEWLEVKERSWKAVVDVLIAVGRALIALHRHQIIHGALSPHGIVITKDGRARVRNVGGTASAFYAAPEQLAGAPLTPEIDQHALCLVAFEALYGRTPFDHGRSDDLLDRKRRGELAIPDRRDVPRRLVAVLKRGLATEPATRWLSLDEFVRQLVRCRRLGTRRLAVGGVALLLVASAMGVLTMATPNRPSCDHAHKRLVGVWDVPTRDAIRMRVTEHAAGSGWITASWPRSERRLDEYAGALRAGIDHACQATYINATQDEATLDAQMACYERRLVGLQTLTALLTNGDVQSFENAPRMIDGLEPIGHCTEPSYLQTHIAAPADQTTEVAVERLRARLARAQTLRYAGRNADALELARSTVAEADRLDYAPVIAEARLLLGDLEREGGSVNQAYEYLRSAYFTALSASHFRVATQAAIQLSFVVSYQLLRYAEAMQWTEHAAATLARFGGDPLLESERLERLGVVLNVSGHSAHAIDVLEQAQALRVEILGTDHPLVARIENNLGVAAEKLGRPAEALDHYERALAGTQAHYGAGHPLNLTYLANALNTATHLGATERAAALLPAARELANRQGQPPSLVLGHIVLATASADLRLGNDAEACTAFARAHDTIRTAAGGDHEMLSTAELGLGRCARRAGRDEEAMQHFEAALDYGALGQDSRATVIEVCLEIADMAWAQRDRTRAKAMARRAHDLLGEESDTVLTQRLRRWLDEHRLTIE